MGKKESNNATKTRKAPVKVIVQREFTGTKTLIEAFLPIISEDIRQRIDESRTLDDMGGYM